MTVSAPARRTPVAARRVGYLVAVLVQSVLLFVINVSPGWEALPILTADAALVIGLINASLTVSIVANLSYVGYHAPWWRAFGDIVTTTVGLAVLLRLWQVFPFDFGAGSVDWALVSRVVLVIAVCASVLGILVQLVTLVRELARMGR